MTFFNKKSTFVPYIRGREITVVNNYSALPDPTTVGDKFYWCENSQGTAWLPGSLGGTYYPRGLYYSNGTTWEYMETPIQATQAEVDAGIIDDRFVSPNTLYNADQWNSVKVKLYTNGAFNDDQNKLNLVEGSNMTITDDGAGNITFDATGGGGSSSIPHATASGTDTYTATITGVTSYADGDAYLIRFPNGNTTGATLNISGVGAVGLYRNNDGPVIGGDIWNGAEMLCIYNSTTAKFQLIGTSPNAMYAYITNADSVTITKGQVVYAFGGQGDRMTVKLANNTGDATSAQTVGVVLSTSIAANQKGVIITQGLLDGLSILPTATFSDGDPLFLGATNGSITNVKPHAPNHLVYLGNITTASNGAAGRWYVRVQNGYELDELHNVQAQSPTNKDTLYYDNTVSPPQWKTASIATISGLKAPIVSVGNGTAVTGTTGITLCKTLSIPINSFTTGDAPQLYVQTTKNLANGTQFIRVYWNTSASLTGAILLASTGAAVASTLSQALIRHLGIEVAGGGGNGTQILQPISGINNPYVPTTIPTVPVAINWTVAGFIIVSIQNGSASDTSNCNLISLK
jgi:hypothetical protein